MRRGESISLPLFERVDRKKAASEYKGKEGDRVEEPRRLLNRKWLKVFIPEFSAGILTSAGGGRRHLRASSLGGDTIMRSLKLLNRPEGIFKEKRLSILRLLVGRLREGEQEGESSEMVSTEGRGKEVFRKGPALVMGGAKR